MIYTLKGKEIIALFVEVFHGQNKNEFIVVCFWKLYLSIEQ